MHRIGSSGLFAALALFLAAAAPAAAATKSGCDEACLLGITGDYLDGITANDIGDVPFAADVRATENGVASRPGEGIWKTAQGWLYRHTMTDPVQGEVVVLGTVSEGEGADAFVVARLKIRGRKIAESELMVSRKGDFSLFAPRSASEPKPIYAGYIPQDRRESRAALIKTARGYFNGLIFGDAKQTAFHPDCNRVENGVQTTNSAGLIRQSCTEGLKRFVYMRTYREVRFPVVDPARGLVLAVTAFDLPDQKRVHMIRNKPFEINAERQHLPRTLFLYELFKIEGGQIRMIEAMMRNMPLGASMGWGGEAGNTNVGK